MKKIVALLILALVLGSCGEYQKALKTEDVGVKYELAEKLYDAGRYSKAIRLFEQIAPAYRGKPQAEKMFYMYAQAYYKTRQFVLAGYQFESFASNYPRSEKVQEASFLGAKCYSMLSPVYSLDQVDTFKAIEKLQSFIDNYPNSEYLKEANATMRTLNEKIEKKVYENAIGYNKIMDYKSALISLDNFIADYPGTTYKEKALYYKLDSAYNLAINSISQKMEERLQAAKLAHATLIRYKADTEYKEKADEMLAKIENELQKFTK
jgi:outer membrane protein assembly factor BamD